MGLIVALTLLGIKMRIQPLAPSDYAYLACPPLFPLSPSFNETSGYKKPAHILVSIVHHW